MSDEMKSMREAMDRGFESVGVRCDKLSGEIHGVSDKVIALDTKWGEHMHTHKRVDDRLGGLEDREREATQTGIKHPPKDSDPPKKNGRINGEKLKTWIQIGFGIGVGLLLVYNLWASPSKEDVEVAADRADSVAAAAEKDLKENRKSREELKKVLQALEPLAEMLETEVTP